MSSALVILEGSGGLPYFSGLEAVVAYSSQDSRECTSRVRGGFAQVPAYGERLTGYPA